MKRKVYLQIVPVQKHTNYRRLIRRNQLNIGDWCITVCKQASNHAAERIIQARGWFIFWKRKIKLYFLVFSGDWFLNYSGVSNTFDHCYKNNPEL